MATHNVLLIGGGGREHALAWKLSQSELLKTLFIAPGNPGTSQFGKNISLDISDADRVVLFCRNKKVDLVVIGPEKPLVEGLADHLESHGISVFGPRKEAAKLEGSKMFAKKFMKKYEIPTASFKTFSSDKFDEALNYIEKRDRWPVVLKADGLAAGKGVFICESAEEAGQRLKQYRENDMLKEASDRLVIEDFMKGEEASVFVMCDGHSAKILHHAQDHKRIGDGDTGLNTGGMGAYSPAPIVDDHMLDRIEREIIAPTITGMQLEEAPYKGILYLGLMITPKGPKVVEYNCRFGDPECQVILPSLKNDLLDLMVASEEQRLDEKEIQVDELFRCCVVLASEGYPGSYQKGKRISGIENTDSNALIFQAGTALEHGELVTSGGRVMGVVGSGGTLQQAIDHAYDNVDKISFEGAYWRKDIGKKGLLHL